MFSFRRGNSHGIVRLRPQITCHPAIVSTNLKIKEQHLRKSNECISCPTSLSKPWLTQSEVGSSKALESSAFRPWLSIHSTLGFQSTTILYFKWLCASSKNLHLAQSQRHLKKEESGKALKLGEPSLKSISKSKVTQRPPIFRAFSSFLAASP